MIFAVVLPSDAGNVCVGIYPDMKSAQALAETKYPDNSIILVEPWAYEPVGELGAPIVISAPSFDVSNDCCPHCGRDWD